ncbi:MAG TPA: c-type cytochrome [Steroidobacteraceae bacterium]|jgi:cytochrome c553
MRAFAGVLVGAAAAMWVAQPSRAQTSDPPPPWAFPVNPPPERSTGPKPPNRLEHVTGSPLAYTDRQLGDGFFTADWFPGEHPPMPRIVEYGRKPATACTYCHLTSGNGGPAEAALPGLPASYIIEQVKEFQAGRRVAAQPDMESVRGMVVEARQVNDADLAAAARYFSQLRFTSHFHIMETDTVPQTRVGDVSIYVRIPGAGSEPLGARIVEVPNDARQWELGNPHTDFTAYVPQGSIARGEKLVASGDGAAPCRACHGPDLRGMGNVPPLAGRSPSYLARQLYDIQHGTRRGPTVAPMLAEVAQMLPSDRIAIVAYLGSLQP